MKAILLSMCFCVTLATPFTLFAGGKTFSQLYEQELREVPNLPNLAEQYFRGPGSLTPGENLTPEMLTDPKRQALYFNIRRLMGLALDANIPLDFLQPYGLIKEPRNYTVEYASHPEWANLYALFWGFTPDYIERNQYELGSMGLSREDITTLITFLTDNHPRYLEAQAVKTMIDKQTESLKAHLPSQVSSMNNFSLVAQTHRDLIVKISLDTHKLERKLRADSWNRWGERLLANFSRHKQRALIAFAQQRLGSAAYGGAPLDEDYLVKFGVEMLSGKESQAQQKAMNEYISEYAIKE